MNLTDTMLSAESKLQKNTYSIILFLKGQRQDNKKNILPRDSHIYSKIIVKARETATTKKSVLLVGRLRGGL